MLARTWGHSYIILILIYNKVIIHDIYLCLYWHYLYSFILERASMVWFWLDHSIRAQTLCNIAAWAYWQHVSCRLDLMASDVSRVICCDTNVQVPDRQSKGNSNCYRPEIVLNSGYLSVCYVCLSFYLGVTDSRNMFILLAYCIASHCSPPWPI